jgi:hypothetical protein
MPVTLRTFPYHTGHHQVHRDTLNKCDRGLRCTRVGLRPHLLAGRGVYTQFKREKPPETLNAPHRATRRKKKQRKDESGARQDRDSNPGGQACMPELKAIPRPTVLHDTYTAARIRTADPRCTACVVLMSLHRISCACSGSSAGTQGLTWTSSRSTRISPSEKQRCR